jgi:hypothetical protein
MQLGRHSHATDKFSKKGHEFVALDVLILVVGEAAQRVMQRGIF